MKNLILKSSLFLGVAVLSAQAQSIKVTVPFGFEATGKEMPAGDYRITKIDSNSGGAYVMRNVNTSNSVVLAGKTPIANPEGNAKLVFRAAADGYYLTELWDGSMGRTLACPRGKSSIVAATRVVIAAHK